MKKEIIANVDAFSRSQELTKYFDGYASGVTTANICLSTEYQWEIVEFRVRQFGGKVFISTLQSNCSIS